MQQNSPINQAENAVPSAQDSPKVSLVIPVYNEEGNIVTLVAEIQAAMTRQPRSWEALFVDDGSNDQSLARIRAAAAADSRLRYAALAANSGQSAALFAGFQEAGGEILVTLDADLQNDPADIPLLLELFDQGYDMTIGVRARRQDSAVKKIASKIANAIRNRLTHEEVSDTGCSLKAMRASMVRRLPLFRGMHRFLPTLMKMQGAKVAEAPVNHRPRLQGISKYGVWDRAFSGLYDLLAVRWMQKRNIYGCKIKERG
ncbi:MAG: glycosyltransferase family 2 protein [Desulfovibrio sp.]|nr:glycosyltransferase family 2 protein [Desulfovibrio sp.]